jgi:hypothetical protein
MRWYASSARSSGNVSVNWRTPLLAENVSVSSESIDEPDGHPYIPVRLPIRRLRA